jgi:hypothetical protein
VVKSTLNLEVLGSNPGQGENFLTRFFRSWIGMDVNLFFSLSLSLYIKKVNLTHHIRHKKGFRMITLHCFLSFFLINPIHFMKVNRRFIDPECEIGIDFFQSSMYSVIKIKKI